MTSFLTFEEILRKLQAAVFVVSGHESEVCPAMASKKILRPAVDLVGKI